MLPRCEGAKTFMIHHGSPFSCDKVRLGQSSKGSHYNLHYADNVRHVLQQSPADLPLRQHLSDAR